jgi:hypothetical protein
MKAIRILKHLHQLERGFDITKMKTPLSTAFLRPDRPVSGRLVQLVDGAFVLEQSLTFDEAGERTDVAWLRPSRSTGSRRPAARTKGSVRGDQYDFRTNMELGFESFEEHKFGMLLKADRSVVAIEDQPKAAKFWRPGAEKQTKQTLDYRATFASGLRIGFAVKPAERLEESGIIDDVAYMRLQCQDVADDFVVVTEEEITDELFDNAEEIVTANEARNERDCREVLAFMQRFVDPISIFDLAEAFDEPGCARAAVMCLIYDGLVEHLEPGEHFDFAPLVRLAAN